MVKMYLEIATNWGWLASAPSITAFRTSWLSARTHCGHSSILTTGITQLVADPSEHGSTYYLSDVCGKEGQEA